MKWTVPLLTSLLGLSQHTVADSVNPDFTGVSSQPSQAHIISFMAVEGDVNILTNPLFINI
ncbi:MAG: hypothetical protein ACJA0N_002673 [Pseudohongiellaceae bacterium]|jgi:hypothetical protein